MGVKLLNQLTCCMGSGEPFLWPEGVTERWDFASTGSVANITPIFGYLWLMAKAHANYEKEKAFTIVVPKISSKGASCGTVDILEAGGLAFPSDPNEIIRRCQTEGGVLCQQDDALTPVDKELMKRRKETNTMKSAALVYASIIGKKIAMGCTHVVVDVKVGKDTKMFAPWMSKDMSRFFWDASSKSLVVEDYNVLLKLLNALGQEATVKTSSGVTWVEQECVGLGPIKNLRWFLTNADQPQCRAIGRELILLHLDCLLGENGEDQLLKEDNNYNKLYCITIPALCNIMNPDFDQIKKQWSILRRRLPGLTKIDQFVTRDYLNKINESSPREKIEQIEVGHDLSAVTFGLDSYQYFDNEAKIKSINAYYLDQFFEELCAENKYDAEVGFWLHKLPGETVNKNEPFISVFFRSSRTSEHELLSKIRHFLANEVAIA